MMPTSKSTSAMSRSSTRTARGFAARCLRRAFRDKGMRSRGGLNSRMMAASRKRATKTSPTKAPKASKAKGAKALVVEVAAVAPAAVRRAEELLDLIARRKARIAEDFYEIGKALRELSKKKLYAVLGHRSFGEML